VYISDVLPDAKVCVGGGATGPGELHGSVCRSVLARAGPATPGFLGWDPDPVLDGWDAHEGVFRLLEPHVIAA
jgi:hypothetical protein